MPQEDPAQLRGDFIAIAVARPVTVLVGVVLVLLFGVFAVRALPIQLTPDVTIPTITVTTRWPGGAPLEVESEILEEQEDALKSTPGLVQMESEAKPDEASITLELEVGTSLDEALVRVTNRLAQVPDYPDAAREPIVSTSSNAGPPLSVITIRSPTGAPVAAYRTWVEETIIPRIERVKGVAGIAHLGGQDSQVQVDFDVTALAARGISVNELARRVAAELRDVSGGNLDLGKRRLLVRTAVAPEVPEDLEQIVIGVGSDGTPILLRDVAHVHRGLRAPVGIAMSDNRPSMVLLLWREAGTNVLEVSQNVRQVIAQLDAESFAPEGLQIQVVSDQTGYITDALDLVRQNIIIGSVLAILVLLLFLRNLAACAVIGVAIPISVFGAALGMSLLGRTINVVSLAGTAFAVGMVVDNSIVALESIDTWQRRGKSAAEAAYLGVQQIWGALIASTATTIVVFVPIIGWQDEVGELLRDIAIAISLSIGVSLIVSVVVIPSFAAQLLRWRGPSASVGAVGRMGARVSDRIAEQVELLIRTPRRCALAVLVSVAGSLGLAVWLLPSMEYLPTGNRNLVFGIQLPPPGYSPAELETIARTVQSRMAVHTGVERDGVPAIHRTFFVGDPSQAFFGAVAEDPTKVAGLVPFVRELGRSAPGAFSFASQASLFATGIGGDRSVEIEIAGADLTESIGFAGRLMGLVAAEIPGSQIRPIPSLDLGAPEIHAVPRRDEAAALGVSGAQLGLVVDAYVDGAYVGELSLEGQPKVDVVLRAIRHDGRLIDDPEALAIAPVAAAGGRVVPLGSLADVSERLGPTRIQRIERRRAITLQVSPPDDVPLEDAMRRIRYGVIASLEATAEIPSGITVSLTGTAGKLERAKQSFGRVLLMAVLICYLLLAALYEDFVAPIAVLVTVPLAGAGGVLALYWVDRYLGPQPFDLVTALGFVILVGTVVNNAILVVDGALALLRQGEPLVDALREGVRDRLRPIAMTTTTSLAGLLPLVISPGSGAELYRGIGAVVLGGLTLSTVLTVYIVPSLFALLWRARGN